jgi:MFS family permease
MVHLMERGSFLSDLKLSDDGLYYWDGQKWVSTLSNDGRSRWNGTAWVPVGTPATPGFYVQPRTGPRVPTGWTKPLQWSVVAYYVASAIWAVAGPFLLAGPLSDYFNQVIQQQAALNPTTPPPPAEVISTIQSIITVALGVGAAVGVAIAAVAIIGALRRWTWVFYAVLVLLGLGTVSFPFTLVSAFTTSTLSPMKLPVALTAASIAFAIPGIALFIWMAVAAFRRGPWAMTRSAA